jgi:uncharacterized protein
MSVFKEHKRTADRSSSDRMRHKKKIEKAIREGVHNIVSEESIIGQDGKKKIRIPVRGIKEYRFIYGDNSQNKKVGSAPDKDIKRGQKVGEAQKQKGKGDPDKAGNEKGEEYYEIEITLEELSHYLFKDLELPDLERKALKNIVSEKFKRHGYRDAGIRPRLDKRETLKKKIKRKMMSKRHQSQASNEEGEEENFSFHEDDLRYRHIKKTTTESSNAVIFFLMDISGSMTNEKKFLARSFYFLLYHFLRHKYDKIEIVFIAHDTNAYEVNEEQFFSRGQSGGTIVSSGLERILEIIHSRFHPDNWNLYCFQCSDGDNWPSDSEKTILLAEKIKNMCQLFGYCEIEPNEERIKWVDESSRMSNTYAHLEDRKFRIVNIHKKPDIWPAFQTLFGKRALVMGGE